MLACNVYMERNQKVAGTGTYVPSLDHKLQGQSGAHLQRRLCQDPVGLPGTD